MSDPSFDEHVRGQFPLRPSHPDFERLREVVDMVEVLKKDPARAREIYDGFVDAISVSYLGANRMGMNIPAGYTLRQRKEIHELLTNAWVEGVFFGVYFQILGGHQEESETPSSTS